MRVLFVNENIGGHATVHHNLEAAFRLRDDIDPVWLHVPPPSVGRRLVGAAVPGLAAYDLDLQPLRAQLAVSSWVRRRLPALLDGVDAVHVYTQNAALLSVDLLRNRPTVVTTDSTNLLNAFRLPYRQAARFTGTAARLAARVEQRVYDTARLVVANSDYVAESLRNDYGVREPRLRVLPFGVGLPEAPPARTTTEGRLPRVLFVGRGMDRKGGSQLLRLHQQHLADVCELVLVTQDSVPPGRNVTVHQDVRQGDGRIGAILAAADVFAFPSHIDQAPNAVLEAMAAGLPVVACPMGAVPEMVLDGTTGLLVPSGDDAALLAALQRLLADTGLRLRLGAAGAARARERYDMSRAAEELVSLLHEVAGRTRVTVSG